MRKYTTNLGNSLIILVMMATCRCQWVSDVKESLLSPRIFTALLQWQGGVAAFAKAATRAISAQVIHHGVTVEAMVWQAKRQTQTKGDFALSSIEELELPHILK